MRAVVDILSAGAAQGLVRAVQPGFERDHACRVQGRFGAVGAMRQALDEGAPCDLLILTGAQIREGIGAGRLDGRRSAALGGVSTGVAVTAGSPRPSVDTPQALAQALAVAVAVFIPDPERATAGIHALKVIRALGLGDALAPRLRTYPNGATAMAEMAASGLHGAIGCTQVTEILYTPGVDLVAPLPAPYGLTTVYSAAVVAGAPHADAAWALLQRLVSAETAPLRAAGGFEPVRP